MSAGLRAGVSRAAASHRLAAVRGAVTMLVTGLCLLAAPAAHADLDDVFDTIVGGPGAGVDSAPTGDADTQPGTVNFGSFNDPLAQLARLFRDAPAGAEGTASDADDADRNAGGDLAQNENTDSGDDSSNLPKPSMPSSGNGNGNGNGNSGSGNHSGNHAKAKAHPNSAKAATGLHKADVDDNR